MTKKIRDRSFWRNVDKPHDGKGEMAVPVIIINSKGEVGLICQDNVPTYRIFGNGCTDETVRHPSRRGKYYDNMSRIIENETNLPIGLIREAQPVARFNFISPTTDEKIEANRIFVINIGDFPIESKKGAYVEFFKPDELPHNMNTGHRDIVLMALKGLKRGRELQSALETPPYLVREGNSRVWQLQHMIENGGTIHGVHEGPIDWMNHPKVLANPYSEPMRKRLAALSSRLPQQAL